MAHHPTPRKTTLAFSAALLAAVTFLGLAGIVHIYFLFTDDSPAYSQTIAEDYGAKFLEEVETRLSETRRATQASITSEVSSASLFGKVVQPEPAVPELEEIPETNLSLSIHGIFASQAPEQAAALISARGDRPRYIRLGEEVVPGTQLFAIDANWITLRTGETYEKLGFPPVSIWTGQGPTETLNAMRQDDIKSLSTPPHKPESNPPDIRKQRKTGSGDRVATLNDAR